MNESQRIISLVPSWTETLIAARVPIVARAPFCIHSADKISSIPDVGGNKKLQIAKITLFRPSNKLQNDHLRSFGFGYLEVLSGYHVSQLKGSTESQTLGFWKNV